MPAKILSASASPKKSSSIASTSLKSKPIQKPGSFSYALYLHREELRKRRTSSTRVSRTKFLLTHELITKTMRNINKCSAEDLENLNRQAVFKKNLYHQLIQQRQSQHSEAQKMQQQPQQLQRQQQSLPRVQETKRQPLQPLTLIQCPKPQPQQKKSLLLQRQNSMQFMKY
ncbi:uncharacterized protein [Musca autumnalis]|uniref:uncharacterized protein n=1 Tax=Musca autumnalis TaxID=221902 RepID=UPI003CECAEB8